MVQNHLFSFISQHVVQTDSEIWIHFLQKPLNIFHTIVMHPFLYVVTNNLAYYQFLTLCYYGKIERNKYLLFTMLCTLCHVGKSCTNKTIFQRMHNENFGALSTTKCRMHKVIKLNYFEHINILESYKQPGIDNKSSNFIPEMVSCFEIKIQGFFLQKKFWDLISIHCEVSKKNFMSALHDHLKTCSTKAR